MLLAAFLVLQHNCHGVLTCVQPSIAAGMRADRRSAQNLKLSSLQESDERSTIVCNSRMVIEFCSWSTSDAMTAHPKSHLGE